MEKKRQIILLTVVALLLIGTGVLLWWGNRPITTSDESSTAIKTPKEKKDSTSLFSDPRFQELQSKSGPVTVGTKGNANPFEPFK